MIPTEDIREFGPLLKRSMPGFLTHFGVEEQRFGHRPFPLKLLGCFPRAELSEGSTAHRYPLNGSQSSHITAEILMRSRW